MKFCSVPKYSGGWGGGGGNWFSTFIGQCSATGVTKAVVCTVLSVEWCI